MNINTLDYECQSKTHSGRIPYIDAFFKRAVEAGATVKQPVENKFYGERAGCLADPFGHLWTVMTHVEDVPPQELKKRMDEFCAKMAPAKGA